MFEGLARSIRRHLLAAEHRLERWIERFHRLALDENTILLVFAVVVGVIAAYTVVGFFLLIDAASDLLLGPGVRGGSLGLPRVALVVLPAAGIGAAHLLNRVRPREVAVRLELSHMMHAVAKRGARIDALGAAVRFLAAGVTMATGGSVGSEGPVASAGGAAGSVAGSRFRFASSRLKVLVACGSAAGISAAFNAPIAGVMFALEIVLGSLALTAFAPVVVASVVGAVISRAHLGSFPLFAPPEQYAVGSSWHLLLFAVEGIAAGLVAVAFIRIVYAMDDVLAPVRRRSGLLLAVGGGVAVGAVGFLYPEILGRGNRIIGAALAGGIAGPFLVQLIFAKILATALTLGAGGSGGVFTPSVFVGAMFGGAFGWGAAALFPGTGLEAGAFALTGTAAVVAGTTHAPLTAIIIIFELTDDYALILPLMLGVVLAYLSARGLSRDSIYDGDLRRAGERLIRGADQSVLGRLRVEEVYDDDPHVLSEAAPIPRILEVIEESNQSLFPVVDREIRLVGVITFGTLGEVLESEALHELLVAADIVTPDVEVVTPDETLLDALRTMGTRDLDYLPVVDRDDSRRLRGLVSRRDITTAYERELLRELSG